MAQESPDHVLHIVVVEGLIQFKLALAFFEFAGIVVCDSALPVAFFRAWLQLNLAIPVLDRAADVSGFKPRAAAAEQQRDAARLQFERTSKVRDRLAVATDRGIKVAASRKQPGVVGFPLDFLTNRFDGVFDGGILRFIFRNHCTSVEKKHHNYR